MVEDFKIKPKDMFGPLAILEWIKQGVLWNLGKDEIVPYDKLARAAEHLRDMFLHQHMIERQIPD